MSPERGKSAFDGKVAFVTGAASGIGRGRIGAERARSGVCTPRYHWASTAR
jgi:hypothetical protein